VSDGPTWRQLLQEATDRLGDRTEARRIGEEASGADGATLLLQLDERSTPLTHARFVDMLERRAGGEPLQYVLGRWGFRTLDVLVDRRVLIPRPETEMVVEYALQRADAVDARTAVDLGTGSGVIALSLARERPLLSVWAVDVSEDALDVARANLAGLGRAAARVRTAHGSWFSALPPELKGAIDLVVSNPPYVAETEALPREVSEWEPRQSLVAGPTGLEAITQIVGDATEWMAPGGALVMEIGETQADAAVELAASAGLTAVDVRPDLAGKPRVLLARWSAAAEETP
jgi:release factor glutamine methyltransferase